MSTQQEFRDVIADELEALAKRVREPQTSVLRTLREGQVGFGPDIDLKPARDAVSFIFNGEDWAASLSVERDREELKS